MSAENAAHAHEGHGEAAHADHATVGTYIKIAVILTVVTVIELIIPYVHAIPTWFGITALAVLSIGKFALVVMFFMHLYYDSRFLTFLFTIGLFIALGSILSVKALMHIHALEKPEPVVVEKEKLQPADAKRGKVVIEELGCAACHNITEIPAARGNTGPALDGIGTRAATRRPNYTAEAYIRESIEKPLVYIVPGYTGAMPAGIRDRMSDQQYEDLVAYLLTLK